MNEKSLPPPKQRRWAGSHLVAASVPREASLTARQSCDMRHEANEIQRPADRRPLWVICLCSLNSPLQRRAAHRQPLQQDQTGRGRGSRGTSAQVGSWGSQAC